MKVKKEVKKSLSSLKRVINSNKQTKRVAVSVKKLLIRAIGTTGPRELYNLASFYPTIKEYYDQTKDFDSKKDPLISILLPTYNTPEIFLRECIESIIVQSYSNWELCIADDSSTDKNVISVIEEYQKADSRIKLVKRPKNGHISEATNSALKIANGDFVALMDHDDVLWPNAVYEMVRVIRTNPNVDFIYSDEDKLDGSGKIHSYPFLKPDFSPEFLESCNYITHFSSIRTTVMHKVGGFRKGYEGAQDWDLFLRISEITQNIIHIPKILYSWRIHEASTASNTDAKPYVYEAQRKLLVDHIERTGMHGVVETGIITQHRTIKYDIKPNKTLTVVVFISDLSQTLRLVKSLSQYKPGIDYSIVYAHTVFLSDEEKNTVTTTLSEIKNQKFVKVSLQKKYRDSLVEVESSSVLFVEDTISVAVDNWAKIFLSETQRMGVGMVGPVLLDSSKETVMSAGIGMGYGTNGTADMLKGMPFNDPHYSRGLYVKSRRNVSALNPSVFAVATTTLRAMLDGSKRPLVVTDMALDMIANNYRHVYTPYVQFVSYDNNRVNDPLIFVAIEEDQYLNPNFNHENGRMEVRA